MEEKEIEEKEIDEKGVLQPNYGLYQYCFSAALLA